MNNKLKIGLLLLTVISVIILPEAIAKPNYASATGLSCGTCHVSAGGGGPLTSYGSSFAAQAGHSTDPAGTIALIGQPPGTTQPIQPTQLTQLTQPAPSTIRPMTQSTSNSSEITEENDHNGKTSGEENEHNGEHDSEQDDD